MNLSESVVLPIVSLVFFSLVVIIIFREYKNRSVEKITKKDLGWLYYNRSYAIRKSASTPAVAIFYFLVAVLAILKGNGSSLERINFTFTQDSLSYLFIIIILIACFELIFQKRVKDNKDWGPDKRWY